ncbi:glycine receptor subunit alpha-2-like [Ptychodera flava]|uniref:glycine receptor subunit alpha-2-like n=1 Tax=Ptychodera flava TaxID=63121 RepID=UPI00396A5292
MPCCICHNGVLPIFMFALLVCMSSCALVLGMNATNKEQGDYAVNELSRQSSLLTELKKGQDNQIRPQAGASPVDLKVNLYVASFNSVTETDMEYSITIYYRQFWNDPRLRHNSSMITVSGDVREKFWTPDTFFLNAKDGIIHDTSKHNSLFYIQPNGDITYSLRITLSLSCHMDLAAFPFDVQDCGIKIMSYAYRVEDITLHWLQNASVEVEESVQLPQYHLIGTSVTEGIEQYIPGNFSYLNAYFHLERQLGYYLCSAYIPSIALYIISLLTLWIDPLGSPARATLGITTLLALITQSSLLRSGIPKVAYVTALDIWLTTCNFLVFLIMIEYALVYSLHKVGASMTLCSRENKRVEKQVNSQDNRNSNLNRSISTIELLRTGMSLNTDQPSSAPMCERCSSQAREYVLNDTVKMQANRDFIQIAKRTDKYSRVIFISVFFIFTIIYWTFYYFSII